MGRKLRTISTILVIQNIIMYAQKNQKKRKEEKSEKHIETTWDHIAQMFVVLQFVTHIYMWLKFGHVVLSCTLTQRKHIANSNTVYLCTSYPFQVE